MRPASIFAWEELQDIFCRKFFPEHKTIALKRQIQAFSEKPGETFSQYWERYKEMLNRIPHHDFTTYQLVQIFYQGITLNSRRFIQTMCNGEFLYKEHEEALDFIEQIAQNSQSWDISDPHDRVQGENSSSGIPGAKFFLGETEDLHAKIAKLNMKIDKLGKKQSSGCKLMQLLN